MSDAGDSARVQILLADYAVGVGGKLTVVGGGISVIGLIPNTYQTGPFAVVAIVTFDPSFIGESPAVELLLEDHDGRPVVLPGAVGPQGQPQYIRVGLANPLQRVALQNLHIPTEAARPSVQIVLNFNAGLVLTPGQRYTWRIKVDQDTREEWTAWMYVPQPAQPPVLG